MGSYSFKSAGRTVVQRTDETQLKTPVPIGIKTPIELGKPGDFFKMHTDLASQVHDNLKNLVLTNWGERLGRYNFGANLRPLLSDWTTQDDFDSQAIGQISSAVGQWMPYVSLDNFVSEVISSNNIGHSVKITVSYNVPALEAMNKALEIVLRIM